MNVRTMTRIALFAALLCVTAQIAIPVGVATLTLQPFALALAGALLGWKGGCIAAAVYVALGAAGLPVFAGFAGGIARLIGPTGGYLWTYPLVALGAGLGKTMSVRAAGAAVGLCLMELVGAWQLSACSARLMGPYIAIFAPKDAVLILAAVLSAEKIRRILKWPKW